MPIIIAIFAAIAKWFSRMVASIVAKIGLTTFQTILGYAIIALKIVIALAIANLIFLLFNTMQDLLDFTFTLGDTSTNENVVTSIKVLKSVGVWDGMIDAITLILPFFETILVIKLSQLGIRLLETVSNEANKVIKTALSYGV